jgi:mRNA interferase MazF
MTRSEAIRRGDVVWINCDPSAGVEPRKTRSCVVVSNDLANRYGQAITIVPTQEYTKERAGRAYRVDLRRPRSPLKEARVANCSMVMTYDRSRLVRVEGPVTQETMNALERALRVHLDLATWRAPYPNTSANALWFALVSRVPSTANTTSENTSL